MAKSYFIRNVHIIDPSDGRNFNGDILIENGVIADIGEKLIATENAVIVNGEGLTAAPGLIDLHVHLRDPGFPEKEDVLSGCEAAAAGGVTAVCAMPNTKPATDSVEIIKYLIDKSKNAKARVYPVGSVTKGLSGKELTDFKALKEAGAVAFSDDGYPVATAGLMLEALTECENLGVPVLAHCEDLTVTNGGIMNKGVVSDKLGVQGVHEASENVGTVREMALAYSVGARVHICHVSTRQSVEWIRMAKKMGVRVTAETGPHYFTLTEAELNKEDADYRMAPPLRPESDRLAMIEGLKDGTLDAIATDHAPHSPEQKSDFRKAPNGIVGLETSLAAGITTLVKTGEMTLTELLRKMSTVPAEILNVPGGTLKKGASADIVLFNEDEKWTVDPAKFRSRSRNSAFKGMELTGKVKYTFCRGEMVYGNE